LAGLLTLVAAAGLAFLAIHFAGVAGPGHLDTRLDAIIQGRLSAYRRPLYRLVMLAGPACVVCSVVLALAGVMMRSGRLTTVAIAGPVLTGAITLALKPAIGRTLDGAYALPSGHTGGVVSVAMVGALYVMSMAGARRGLVALLSGAVVLVVASGISLALVANNFHYLTDTVAGFCTAVAVVLGTALTVDSVANIATRNY
jgi:undecaprenyl-diphosphatase